MNATGEGQAARMKNPTTAERTSDREIVITRLFDAPPRIVFEAWTRPELLVKWWVPKSSGMVLLSCEMDVRVGGTYRLVFQCEPEPLAFFGRYTEVIPHARLVWTNEEGEAGVAVTTVTFEEREGKTLVVVRELHPSKEALDAMACGMEEGTREAHEQLDELLLTLWPRG